MKKILFSIAALAAIASCSKAPVEENTPTAPEELHDMTVEVSLGEVSRVDIDNDWGVNWEETDELIALSLTDNNYGYFSIAKFDERKAIFKGSIKEGNYRFIHPSTARGKEGKLLLDLTQQEAGAKLTYMRSDKVINPGTAQSYLYMHHIGSVIDLKMKGLPSDVEISQIVVSGLYSTGTHALEDANQVFEKEYNKSNITISNIAEDAISAEGEATVRFNVLPTTYDSPLVAGDKIVVKVFLLNGDILSQTITLTEQTYINRATHKALNCFNITKHYWTQYATEGLAEAGKISSAEELAWLAKSVNNGEEYEGETFTLTQDIDLSAHEWMPIAAHVTDNTATYFKGILDGAGFTISGLNINQPKTNYQGLFGCIYGATVMNLSISGEVIGNSYTGGIAGANINSSTIINCYSSINVKGYDSVGGIAGYSNYSSIINCHSSGNVSGLNSIGGITAVNDGTITNCCYSGEASGTDSVGAIAGVNRDPITNSYWDETLNASGTANNSDTDNSVGMTTTEMQSEELKDQLNENAFYYNMTATTVKMCRWTTTSDVSPMLDFGVEPTADMFSGGKGTETDPIKISNREDFDTLGEYINNGICFSGTFFKLTNDIDLGGNEFTPIGNKDSEFSGTFDGAGFTVSGLYINQPEAKYQGLFGHANGATIKNLSVEGEITGAGSIGGIVAQSYATTIINCHSNVDITGSQAAIGGIVGLCKNNSTIANCYNNGTISGRINVGGISGACDGPITNCYNSGKITAIEGGWAVAAILGGWAGSYDEVEISDCYWNITINNKDGFQGINDSNPEIDTTEPKTTTEMSSYAFATELNTNAKEIEGACAWRETLGGFPILIFGSNPADQLEGLGQGGGLRK